MRATLFLFSIVITSCDIFVPEVGAPGQPCFSNNTCLPPAQCNLITNTCVTFEVGKEGEFGGPCRKDGTCDIELKCVNGICQIRWEEIKEGATICAGCSWQNCSDSNNYKVFNKPFYMMKSEVTVAMYNSCIAEKACSTLDECGYNTTWTRGEGRLPVNCVRWTQADEFCKWAGGRLPTSAEWEYAAKTLWLLEPEKKDSCDLIGDPSKYPSWSFFQYNRDSYCNLCWAKMTENNEECKDGGQTREGPTKVCSLYDPSYHKNLLCDMCGNLSEWVSDCQDNVCDIRGSPWFENLLHTKQTPVESKFPPPQEKTFKSATLGFRCVKDTI